MATITSTVFVTSANNPYTLTSGSTISVSSPNNNGRAGEAIYTTYSPTNATTIGGPTIVIDGVVIDNSPLANADEYGIQSKATADATLLNFGVISAPNLFAAGINDGLVVNELNSTITGAGGIKIGTGLLASTIVNAGTILGSTAQGVDFLNPGISGFVTNTNSGFIRGGTSGGALDETGVYIIQGTVTNAGTISHGAAAGYSVDFFSTLGNDRLILDPGQVLNGVASASGAGNFIILGGTGAGTLANPANYHGFTLVSVAAGADWQIGSPSGTETFSGIPTISDGGYLVLEGAVDSTNGSSVTPTTIDMNGNGAHSTLDLTGSMLPVGYTFPNPITDFGLTDTIIVPGFTSQPLESLGSFYNTATGVLTVAEYFVSPLLPSEEINISISGPGGALSSGQFQLSVGPGGLLITDTPCFAAGTRILTPDGEVAVEDITPGTEVLTARGGREGVAEVIWVGRRTVDIARHAMPEKIRPIRILAGAFGPGLPERDLRLSPDHALYIDGHLIEAKTLVNGVTVIVEHDTRFVTYHHIELASHDIVLAEGLPAETYLESGNRMMFESDAAPMVLHPDFVTARREAACAPLALEGEIVTAARQRLLDRAHALGFAVTDAVDLVVKAGVERIRPEPESPGPLQFILPPGTRKVELLSGAGVPAEISADPRDRRALGVAVTGLALVANGEYLPIKLDDAAHEGFHAMEENHRWTNGAARIALPAYSGRAVLEVAINGQAARWSATNPPDRRMG
jgi:hypothetical protein